MKTKNILAFVIMMLLQYVIVSCDSDNGSSDETTITPTTESYFYFSEGIKCDSDGGKVNFSFNSTKPYNIAFTKNWCHLYPNNSGKVGKIETIIEIEPNTQIEDRECELILSAGTIEKRILIQQKGSNTYIAKVKEAGTLPQIIGNNHSELTHLTIEGELNGTDIAFIRKITNDYNKLVALDLTNVKIVQGGNSYLTYEGTEYFTEEDVFPQYCMYRCSIKEVKLPTSVHSIGNHAFFLCSYLQSVEIPKTTQRYGESAFNGCASLKRIPISNNVVYIGKAAFKDCQNLDSLVIPNSIASLSDEICEGCSKLSSLQIPDYVSSIGEHAFLNCRVLKDLKINTTSIGYGAFSGCAFTTVYLGYEVMEIGKHAFSHCQDLKSITIPDGVKQLDSVFEYSKSLCELHLKSEIRNSTLFL